MNKVFISGNLTRDPEVRYTQNGKAYARMGIAVRRAFRSKNADANNGQPDVDFLNMVAWDKTAEFCGRYLVKGSRVMVEGRIQTGSYEGQDGVKRNTFDIVVDNIEFADSKKSSGDNSGGALYDGGENNSDYSRSESHGNKPERKKYFDEEDGSDIDVPF